MPKATTSEKILKNLPSSELQWMQYISGDNVFHINSTGSRETYILYVEKDGGYLKVATAKNPLDFDEVVKKYK